MTDVAVTHTGAVTCTSGIHFPHLSNEVAGLGDCGFFLSFLVSTSSPVRPAGWEPSTWLTTCTASVGAWRPCSPHLKGEWSLLKTLSLQGLQRQAPWAGQARSSSELYHHQARDPDPSAEGESRGRPAGLASYLPQGRAIWCQESPGGKTKAEGGVSRLTLYS